MIEGVLYLHSKNIIHRDLRCINILVKKYFVFCCLTFFKLDSHLNIKISDFGVSYWNQDKGEIPPPKFYIGEKDMYSTNNDQATKELLKEVAILR